MANGTAPAAQVRSDDGNTVCRLVADSNANDYANPDKTVFVVTTKGSGACGTSSDFHTARRYDAATGSFTSSPLYGIGVVRDATTLAPAYQIVAGGVLNADFLAVYGGHAVGQPNTVFRQVIGSSPGLAIVDFGSSDADSKLVAINVADHTLTDLGTSLTGGANWQLLGHDATAFYVYRNSGSTTASTWAVLKITKNQPTATRLATGNGMLASAAMGQSLLYLTVQQASANKLYSLSKTSVAGIVQMESTPVTSATTVLASASGVHQFWHISDLGTNPSYRIDMVDESGTLHTSANNAMPLAILEPTTIDLSRSENRTRFLYASGFGSQGYADANLVAFDAGAAGASPVVLGKLPSSAAFTGTTVFATAAMALGNFSAGQVVSSSNGAFVSGGAKLFSFKADTANSLSFTSTTR